MFYPGTLKINKVMTLTNLRPNLLQHYAKCRAQKGKRQKFRVESWNSHRMFLGMVDDDCKGKIWALGQTGGAAGPETCKKCPKCVNYPTSIFLQIFDFKWSQRHLVVNKTPIQCLGMIYKDVAGPETPQKSQFSPSYVVFFNFRFLSTFWY